MQPTSVAGLLWQLQAPLFRESDSCRGSWLKSAILPGSIPCQDWGWLIWALPHTTERAVAKGAYPAHPDTHKNIDKHEQRDRTQTSVHTLYRKHISKYVFHFRRKWHEVNLEAMFLKLVLKYQKHKSQLIERINLITCGLHVQFNSEFLMRCSRSLIKPGI